MRKAESSTKLNSFQQARRISLKQNALKIGKFLKIATPALGSRGSGVQIAPARPTE